MEEGAANALVQVLDANNDGEVDFEEFCAGWDKIFALTDTVGIPEPAPEAKAETEGHYTNILAGDIAKFSAAFARMDMDSSGSIDVKELGTLMAFLGQDLDEDKLREMIVEIDTDGSGEIELGEFLTMMDTVSAENNVWRDLISGYKGCRESPSRVIYDSGPFTHSDWIVFQEKCLTRSTRTARAHWTGKSSGEGRQHCSLTCRPTCSRNCGAVR